MKVEINLVKIKHPYEYEHKDYGFQALYNYRNEFYIDLWNFLTKKERKRLEKLWTANEDLSLGKIEANISEIDRLKAIIAGYDQMIDQVVPQIQSIGSLLDRMSRSVGR